MKNAIPNNANNATKHIGASPGILLHASAVKTEKGAMLFLGHSRAGKSTICNLLSSKYEPIADDMIHVQYKKTIGWEADQIYSYINEREANKGINWADKPSQGTPICAIMRIYQSPIIKAQPITQKELCFQLTNSIVEGIGQSISYTGISALRHFRVVAEIARNIPGWSLQFTKNNDTVDYISSWAEKRFTIEPLIEKREKLL